MARAAAKGAKKAAPKKVTKKTVAKTTKKAAPKKATKKAATKTTKKAATKKTTKKGGRKWSQSELNPFNSTLCICIINSNYTQTLHSLLSVNKQIPISISNPIFNLFISVKLIKHFFSRFFADYSSLYT